jgi:CRP-like cAMP-binding protein
VCCTHPGVPPWRFEGFWVLGVLDVMQERPYSRTATAETTVRLAKMRTTEWLDLLDESFDLKRSAVASGVDSVAKLLEQLLAMGESFDVPDALATPVDPAPMNLVDRMLLLMDIALFRGAGVQILADLAALMTERVVEAGTVIHARHAPRQVISIVVNGLVESRREAPDLSMRFMRGQLAGAPLIVGPSAAHWETVAVTRTKLLELSAEDWFDEMEEQFGLARSALVALAVERERLLNRTSELTDGAIIY